MLVCFSSSFFVSVTSFKMKRETLSSRYSLKNPNWETLDHITFKEFRILFLEMKNCNNSDHYHHNSSSLVTLAANTSSTSPSVTSSPSRYENQKRRDWNTFGQYLKNHRPPLSLSRCSGAHVLEFLHNLDQFGKTKVHTLLCPFYGYPSPPAPCPCPLQQACGSLDALIGRLRAAYEENGWPRERNPFGDRAVRLYLGEIQELQSRARGVSYEKKKRKWKPTQEHQHITPKTSTFQALPLPPGDHI